MVTIGFEKSLSKSEMYEHSSLENIKKLETNAGKCDDQHQYKAIIEVAMVSNPEGCTDNIPMSPNQYESAAKPSARK